MECDRTGNFRGEIISYGLWNPSGKKSTSINFTARITEWFDPDTKEWVDFLPYNMDVEGDIWIINKEGKLREDAIKDVCEYIGWNGDTGVFARRDWEPRPFGFSVESEVYKEKERFKVGFINSYDYTPGAGKATDPEVVKSLNQLYGAQLRALAGSASKPKAPSSPPPKPAQRETVIPGASNSNRAAMAAANAVDDSQIPF